MITAIASEEPSHPAAYITREDAAHNVSFWNEAGLPSEVYQCLECGWWHVGNGKAPAYKQEAKYWRGRKIS